jgi:hypothetical protein
MQLDDILHLSGLSVLRSRAVVKAIDHLIKLRIKENE